MIAGTTTLTKYVYDNEDILLELNGSNVIVARYTHGPGIDEPLIMEKNSQSFYYHADGLGSITDLTNSSGAVAQRYTYSSFGKIESQLDPNFTQSYTYTSREFDAETGLYYYRARHYDSTIGRFLQEDPIQVFGGSNFYAMTDSSPIIWIDPWGLWYTSGHINVTTMAMKNAGYSAADIATVVAANTNVDRPLNQLNNADHSMPGMQAAATSIIETKLAVP